MNISEENDFRYTQLSLFKSAALKGYIKVKGKNEN